MPSPRELVILALLAAMEALSGFVLVVGSSLLDGTRLGYSAFWLLLAVCIAALGIGIAIARFGPGEPWNRVLLVAAAVTVVGGAGVATADSGVGIFFTVVILGLLFWRGLTVAELDGTYEDVRSKFGWGFAILFIGITCILARGILYEHAIWYMVALVGLAYILTSMLALGLARVSRHRERGAGTAVLLAVGVQLVLLMVLAFAALQIFALDFVGAFLHATRPTWDALGSSLLRFLGLWAGGIDGAIAWIKAHGHARSPAPGRGSPADSRRRKRLQPSPPAGFPGAVYIFIALGCLILVGISVLIWRALPRVSKRQRPAGFRETRRDMMSPLEMWNAVLTWILTLFRRSTEATGEAVARARKRIFGDYPADPVRRVYVQLMRRAAAAGAPRPIDVTPLEYADLLSSRWPEAHDDLVRLTDTYVRRRYAEQTVGATEMKSLQESWHRLRGMIRAPKGEPRVPRPR